MYPDREQDSRLVKGIAQPHDDPEPGDNDDNGSSSAPKTKTYHHISTHHNTIATQTQTGSPSSRTESSSIESVITTTASHGDGHMHTFVAVVGLTPEASAAEEVESKTSRDAAAGLVSVAPGAVGLASLLGLVFAI